VPRLVGDLPAGRDRHSNQLNYGSVYKERASAEAFTKLR